MLKRTRSTTDTDSRSSATLMNESNGYSGDRQRTCALTSEACEILNDLRKSNLLCDATITTKDPYIVYPVHRFILAGKFWLLDCRDQDIRFFLASSPYFRMAFTNGEQSDRPSLQLDLRNDVLDAVLNYAYTDRCALTMGNVFSIIEAAQLCQMKSLLEYCCDFLAEHLDHENIFQMYKFAKANSNSKLLNTTYNYLM